MRMLSNVLLYLLLLGVFGGAVILTYPLVGTVGALVAGVVAVVVAGPLLGGVAGLLTGVDD